MDRVFIAGEETFPLRMATANNYAGGNGILRLTCFPAEKSEAIARVKVCSGGTAGVGATLVRLGVYLIGGTPGAYTGKLVAATANDTTLFTAVNTVYTKTFTAPFWKTSDLTYALGVLTVGATTQPTLCGSIPVGALAPLAADPPFAYYVTGQSDLPATPALVNGDNIGLYAQLLP